MQKVICKSVNFCFVSVPKVYNGFKGEVIPYIVYGDRAKSVNKTTSLTPHNKIQRARTFCRDDLYVLLKDIVIP